MIDLAEHMNGKYIPMKEIADRQDVSLKYMTKIMQVLTKTGMLDGQHGKGGGYKLNRDPAEYTSPYWRHIGTRGMYRWDGLQVRQIVWMSDETDVEWTW